MMYKDLNNLSLKTLKKSAPEALQAQPVSALLLALGSNHEADIHLSYIQKKLATLGVIELSTAFENPDFTATLELPKPNYTNQCVYLALSQPLTLQHLQQTLKQFEDDCNRQRIIAANDIRFVTMDIDILLIQTAINNSLSNKKTTEWIIMADRYPFKAHEQVGIEELIAYSVDN